jgi:DNA-binding LytR/AlgR family response regulator
MNNKKIIIVEDEALIADHIAMILADAGYEISGIFDEAETLFTAMKNSIPDAVLLDINLNGALDGVDIANEINKEYHVPIIFLTSNTDVRTIERVKYTKPAGFITKPYTPEELVSNLSIILFKAAADFSTEQSNPIVEDVIFIKDRGVMTKVYYNSILYAEAIDNYTLIFTENKKFIVPQTLKKVTEMLIPHGFFKSHRSYLVNESKITAIHPKAIMIGEKEIPLSENLRADIINRFKTI